MTRNDYITPILQAIEEQGVSQASIAEKAGLNQKTVNNLLSGRTKKVDLAVVNRLREVLGLEGSFGPSLEDQLAYQEWQTLSPDQKLQAVQLLRKLKEGNKTPDQMS